MVDVVDDDGGGRRLWWLERGYFEVPHLVVGSF